MTSSLTEDWTHTAIVLLLPAEGATRHIVNSIEDAVEEVLASPEFDEVSVHLVISTLGNHMLTSPSLDAVLLKVIAGTEASTISLVWCTDEDVEDGSLSRDLDALHAVHVNVPILGPLEHASPFTNISTVIRDIVIGALDAADGAGGAPSAAIKAAVTGFNEPSQQPLEHPANAAIYGGREPTRSAFNGARDLSSPLGLPTSVESSLQFSAHERFPSSRAFDARTEQDEFAEGWPELNRGDDAAHHSEPLAPKEPDRYRLQSHIPNEDFDVTGSTADSFQPLFHDAGATAAEDPDASTGPSIRSFSFDHAYDAEDNAVLPGSVASPYAQPDSENSKWVPPVVHNVVSSVTSQVDQWRARRTKVRRAEEQIGISALAHLPVYPEVPRPLIYLALAASTEWDKKAVRTRDAALTLLSDALDHNWIAVVLNLGSTLTRVAGPGSPKHVTHDWRRIERNNDFDLGNAAAELSTQFSRDKASLRLRGHEVDAPHVVVFATEPPYVDSVAHSAYLALLRDVQSVTWLLVGDSNWMEFPPELDEGSSRVLYAEQDGVALLLSEVLAPPEVIPPEQDGV